VATCTGQGVDGDHCCWMNGRRCPFLVENVAGRRYACGLRVQLGSWKAVVRDPRYRPVGECWESVGQPFDYCLSFDPALCCRREVSDGDVG
jgi:hypothetical protein